jgi:hypothetical protein
VVENTIYHYYNIAENVKSSEAWDQVSCGVCGQRFSLADLPNFLQHKMTGSCSGTDTSRGSDSSPRNPGSPEAVGDSWEPQQGKNLDETAYDLEGINTVTIIRI